jgi:hypothetical protein
MVGPLLKGQGIGGLIPLGGTLVVHMAYPSAVPETLQAPFGSAHIAIYLAESEPYGSLVDLDGPAEAGFFGKEPPTLPSKAAGNQR